MNKNQQSHLQTMIREALAAGAEGVWLVSGADSAVFGYVPEGEGEPTDLYLDKPHELIAVMRFPVGDGREPGIEFMT